MALSKYLQLVEPTDRMPPELHPVLLGIYGEVGSVMATSKKYHREKQDYAGYRTAVVEEFGDVLWYFAAIGRRLSISLETLFDEVSESVATGKAIVANDSPDWPIAVARKLNPAPELDAALLTLGQDAASLLSLASTDALSTAETVMRSFATSYLDALQASGMTFGNIASYNAKKTRGRFLEPVDSDLPTFDDAFEEDERIPDSFEIHIVQRKSGKSYLKWNGVFLGDPLTDSIGDSDGYRFHDVFHLAHAAVLHWSPVFRALIRHKRKSDPGIDESQDGGRAAVVEEGLTAWIFSQAKDTGFFAGRSTISFDLLKGVQRFVAGYEVDQCPLKLWEQAILQGYRCFLEVRENSGGILVGDRDARTLTYKPLVPDA